MNKKLSLKKLITLFVFSIVTLAFVIGRLRWMDVPLDRDEGSYLYMGYCFINGYVPYLDFYEMKPPGIFIVYGLFHLIFGSSNFLLHFGILLTQFLIGFLIFRIVTKVFDSQTKAFMSVGVYFVFNLFIGYLGFGLLSEHFFLISLLSTANFLIKSSSNRLFDVFLAGIFFGLAAMIRQHAIFFVIPIIVLIFISAKKNNESWIKNMFIFVAGSLSPILTLVLYVTFRGGFQEMVFWVITHPSEKYITKVPWSIGKQFLQNYLNNYLIDRHYPMLILFGFSFFIMLRNIILARKRWENIVSLLFFVSAVSTIFPGFRFYGHYWLMIFPFFAIISSQITEDLFTKPLYNYLILLITSLLFFIQFYINKDFYYTIKPDKLYQDLYQDNPNFALSSVSKYLKKIVGEEDEIFVFGSEPQVYYQSRKILKIPHAYLRFLHLPSLRAFDAQKKTISYLNTNMPDYIVHVQNSISIGMREDSNMDIYNWVFSFESNYYTPILLVEIDNRYTPSYFYNQEAKRQPIGDNYIIVYKLSN